MSQTSDQPEPPRPDDSAAPVTQGRVLVNVISNWLRLGANIVGSLVVVPYMLARLGPTQYGVWATLGGLLGFLMLLDLGSTSAINRYVARYRALGQLERVNASVASAVLMFLGISGLLQLVAWIGAPAFVRLFPRIPETLFADSVLTLRLVCLGVGIRLLHAPFIGMTMGWHRYELFNAVQVLVIVLRVGLIFALLAFWKAAVFVPALAFVIANAVGLLAQFAVARHLHPGLRLGLRAASRSALGEIVSLGSHVLLITLCTLTIYQGPNFILARFAGPDVVTPFAIGMLLITTCVQGIHGVSQVFTPVVSAIDARNDQRAVAGVVVRACRLVGVISAGLALMLIVVGRPFIELWMHGRTPAAYPVVAILAGAHALLWPNTIVQSAFSGTSRLPPIVAGWLATASGFVIASVLVVPRAETPSVAIALCIAIPMVLQQGLYVPAVFQRVFGVPAAEFILGVHARPLAVAWVVGLLGVWILRHWSPASWSALIAFAAVVGTTYAVAAYAVALDASGRQTVRAALAGVTGRRGAG